MNKFTNLIGISLSESADFSELSVSTPDVPPIGEMGRLVIVQDLEEIDAAERMLDESAA